MATRKLIEVEIGGLSELGGIVTTYKEIAAGRIARTRTSVLHSRNFLAEINEIFQQVKASYQGEIDRLAKKSKTKDLSKLSFMKHNGKTVSVLLSSNTGLYGDIVRRTFDVFARQTKEQVTDIAIIGRLGLSLAQEAGFIPPYTYFDFPDQKVDDQKLHEIALFLIKYEKVIVFYQQFQTIVRQDTVVSDISGNALVVEEATAGNKNLPVVRYLFEPSLEKVLEFFEKEIFASIFEQAIRDSQLAKFASRLVTLDSASENIKKKLSLMVFEEIRLKHREKNKKQNQTFSSMALWG